MDEPAWDSWARAGVLRAGKEARLAGKAAAFAASVISEPPELIDVLHPHGLYRPKTDRWRFHQERDEVGRGGSIGSLPRTQVEDTILDLASAALGGSPDPLHWISLAIQQRLTTADRLVDALHRRKRVACRHELMEILACAEDGAQSPLEFYCLRDVERAHGLPEGRRQAPAELDRRRLWRDVHYEAYRLLVELDGQTGHVGEDRFRDFRRDNAALVAGEATRRYGWHDVRRRTCSVATEVASMLFRGGWEGPFVRCPRARSRPCGRNCGSKTGVSTDRFPIPGFWWDGSDTVDRHNSDVAKPLRIVLASIGVLLALFAVLLAAEQMTLTYYLPTPNGQASEHATIYGPGIAATVVAVLMALVTIGWLIANLVTIAKLWFWAIPIAALIVSYLVAVVVIGLDRPVF